MNPDSIPIISQGKSLYFLIKGNKKRAKETQIRFSKQCIGVSQIRSAVEVISGDPKAAKRTQDEFTSTTPIISQIRSGIEIAIGKTDNAIKTQESYINNLVGKHGKNKIKFEPTKSLNSNKSASSSADLFTSDDEDEDNDNNGNDDEKKTDKNLKINHSIDGSSNYNLLKQKEQNKTTPGDVIEVPDEFLCAITWEIMMDPVICSDGHTYERKAIEDWLNDNDTSPKTNMPLEDNKLIPNRALKNMIQDWIKKYNYDESQVIHTDIGHVISPEDELLDDNDKNKQNEKKEEEENDDELLDMLNLNVDVNSNDNDNNENENNNNIKKDDNENINYKV